MTLFGKKEIGRGGRAAFVGKAVLEPSVRNQWWHDALLVCAKCASGTLVGHVASCVLGVPVLTAVFSSAFTSAYDAESLLSKTVPFVCAWGMTGYWYVTRGRESHAFYRALNIGTATVIALSLSPMTASGRWTHDSVVNPLHAEVWFWSQAAADRDNMRLIAAASGMTRSVYVQRQMCKSWNGPQ